MTSISIVIPAWNEGKTIKSTVEALLGLDYDKQRCEIIVVSGGNDNTHELAQKLSTKMQSFLRYVVIPQGPMGKNAAIQQGIREARGEMIVLLDADTIVTTTWLTRMVEPIEQGACDLTVANSEPVKKNWISDFFMITKTYLLDRISTFSGGSVAFRSGVVGSRLDYYFDTNVRAGVNYLLMRRFMERGLRVMFAKDAHVTTHYPSSLKYFVVCELRWLTALVNIEGVRARTLACNAAVVASLICTLPIHNVPFLLSVLFHVVYAGKRTRIFWIASRQRDTNIAGVFGFIVLSYIYHIIGFISQMKCLLGLSKASYLRQGQR